MALIRANWARTPRAAGSPKDSNFPAEIKMAEEPEVFSGRSIGVLIGGRPVRLVYKEEKLRL